MLCRINFIINQENWENVGLPTEQWADTNFFNLNKKLKKFVKYSPSSQYITRLCHFWIMQRTRFDDFSAQCQFRDFMLSRFMCTVRVWWFIDELIGLFCVLFLCLYFSYLVFNVCICSTMYPHHILKPKPEWSSLILPVLPLLPEKIMGIFWKWHNSLF